MKRSLPPRRGDAEVLGSAWATMPSVRRLGALLECHHEPWFILKTAVEEGFKARKQPYQQGKEALWDPSETSPGG